jgi:hypothetical protein
MCFSATASFVAGGALIPLGGVALVQAWKLDRRYLTLAAFPALFGIQQIFEGYVWRSIDDPGMATSHAAAMAFLFFAYLLWLILTPLAAFFVENRIWLKRVFLGIAVFGGLYGLALYLPLLLKPDWLRIELARNSILYNTQLIYGDIIPKTILRVIYAAVICVPLLASTAYGVRAFGVLITLSVIVAFLFAVYAFTSIWCYVAAVVSVYLVFMIFRLPRRAQGQATGA